MRERLGFLIDELSKVPVLRLEVGSNPIWLWLVAVGITLVAFAVFRLTLGQLVKRLRRVSVHTRTSVDNYLVELIAGTRRFFLFVLAALVASSLLELHGSAANARRWMVVIAVALQVGMWGNRGISMWLERQRTLHAETDPGTVTTLQGLSYVLRLAVWSVVALLMLDNLGFDVSALVAGLGIGGIAIALAVQSVLGDLLASLSIALDKPFVVGDFVIVGDFLGTVTRVGLKTTRVTSLGGEQLIFSNSDLLSSRIRNYKRMQERRVLFSFGVLYQTTPEQLESIPPMVREVIEATDQTRFDRAHFKAFGDSSFDFEVVYYVLAPDYNLYMDCQQTINLAITRRFAEHGIGFAYPTRTLHVESMPPAPVSVLVERDRDG